MVGISGVNYEAGSGSRVHDVLWVGLDIRKSDYQCVDYDIICAYKVIL